MNHNILLLLLTILTTIHHQPSLSSPPPPTPPQKPPENETIYKISKQLCWNCVGEAIQFLYGHNLVRARKMELPLAWDPALADYAQWWGGQRQRDCQLIHSFPEGEFELGENIFWGSGQTWGPMDAVNAWADEEKYYDYRENRCEEGEVCGHYTQIVWRSTRKVGCARVVCQSGDVFITCNYYPPGNYVGERPY